MSIRSFLNLVEIRTKAASVIPFTIGTLYAAFHFQQFEWQHFLLMFISMLSFDMATTVINNYIDFKRAVHTEGYGYTVHNAIVSHGIKESTVRAILVILLVIAVGTGFLLFLETNLFVLLFGGLSFLVGILYSFGPIAISRMPLGEIFSGLFMGFGIIFLAAYIHVEPEQLIALVYEHGLVHIHIDLRELILIFLVSIPAIMGIANIMLANNICDMEEDIVNKRYTLPIYIGKKNALRVFQWAYVVSYLDLIVLLYLGVNPILLLLPLLTIRPVRRHVKQFMAEQSKAKTFVLAVKNFTQINVIRIIVLVGALVLQGLSMG